MHKIKWGVLGVANIAVKKVIPAIQQSELGEVYAIASRNMEKAEQAAKELSIEKSYGSYETLLADPDIDAIYIPLPNHLHVPWSIKSLQAGKHVLCEKPIGLNAQEAKELIEAAKDFPHLKIMEAFMYRFHLQWHKVVEIIEDGKIGQVRTVNSFFSYFNDNPNDVRNIADIGGGGLLDIGCYSVNISRLAFQDSPIAVCGQLDIHPEFKTDILTSAIMQFSSGTATFTCSTQMAPHHRVNIVGERGSIEVQHPYNPPMDVPISVILKTDNGEEVFEFTGFNQFTKQADEFCKSILNDTDVPYSLEDALTNMKVIDAIFASGKENRSIAVD